MSKSAQLKRKAAEYEQKRQYDRALATYTQAIEAAAGIPEELDIPLYNRVGDLHLRLGDLDKAVAYYETAVDLYAEGGFFNNAIALCNKVLRHSPGRTVIYYKLGKISARKSFISDAKQNFLEYATRMEKAGDVSEAFRALKEFADLCPGQDDVRLMLAEQLARAGRTGEALEQLQVVYAAMVADDRGAEATATLERIRALDPAFEPRAGMARQQSRREGLVFLDVDYDKRDGPAPDAAVANASQGGGPTGARASRDGAREAAPEGVAGSVEMHPAAESLVRPHTAESFDEVDLPLPADAHAPGTLDESPLAGLVPLEDPLTSMVSDQSRGPGPILAEFEPTSLALGAPGNPSRDRMDDDEADTGERLTTPDERDDGLAQDISPLDVERTHSDISSPASADDAAEDDDRASEMGPVDAEAASLTNAGASAADALTGYVASLSGDVAAGTGGLPGDLGILPLEAVQEEQAPSAPSTGGDDEYVDLNDWLREGEEPLNPRMTGEEEGRSADTVQTDFSNMLETFKAGVAANVDESDSESHYDLGVAYMEMGLLDEAISQFQKVMVGDATLERRVRAYESLGQCFIEQNEYEVAISSLDGALRESGLSDIKLVGVLYLTGYASERLQRWTDAEHYYRRVFAVDIHFRDVGERLKRAEEMA